MYAERTTGSAGWKTVQRGGWDAAFGTPGRCSSIIFMSKPAESHGGTKSTESQMGRGKVQYRHVVLHCLNFDGHVICTRGG